MGNLKRSASLSNPEREKEDTDYTRDMQFLTEADISPNCVSHSSDFWIRSPPEASFLQTITFSVCRIPSVEEKKTPCGASGSLCVDGVQSVRDKSGVPLKSHCDFSPIR